MVVNSHDAKAYGDQQKDFTLLNDMLFINDTPKGSTDTVLLFIVPASKCQAVLDLCHWDVDTKVETGRTHCCRKDSGGRR